MTQPQKKTRRTMLEEFLAAHPQDSFARYGLAMASPNQRNSPPRERDLGSADAAHVWPHSVTISISLMTTEHIPLFPLAVVLLPGMTLPLHIFEPRYKRMMKTVIDEETPFGVVLARENGIATVGCTATVRNVARTYPDGRMDIVTSGESAY